MKKNIFLFLVLLISLPLGTYLYLRSLADQYHNSTPLVCETKKQNKKQIVFFGDSHTQGTIGSNFINQIQKKLSSEFQLINAGVNGEMTIHALNRLDDIIKCQPSFIIILLGTNDINASFKSSRKAYYKLKYGTTPKTTIDSYKENMIKIIEKLKNKTKAKISVLSIPIIGEQKASSANTKVELYNRVLKKIAAKKKISYLPLYERMAHYMNQQVAWKEKELCNLSEKYVASAAIKRFIWKDEFNKISNDHGLTLLTDCIHLNDRGAKMVTDLVTNFITEAH